MTFVNEADYDAVNKDDSLVFDGIKDAIKNGDNVFTVKNETSGKTFDVKIDFTERQRSMLLLGGLLNYTKENA